MSGESAGPLHRWLVTATDALLPAAIAGRLRTLVRRRRAARERARLAWWDERSAAGEGSTVVDLDKGVRMRLHFGGTLSRLIFRGDFEVAERQFLRAFLRPGDVFVDVGANLGLFTLLGAARVGPRGEVHAFEPCGPTCERLRANVGLNGLDNVTIHRVALSDRTGPAEIHLGEAGWDAFNSLAAAAVPASTGSETVTARPWDEYAREVGLDGRVALMKIDVEGWEVPVLEGGRVLLSRTDAPVLQVEFTDTAANAAGFSCAALYRRLEAYGYRLYRFDTAAHRLEPDPLRPAYPYTNLFAVKDLDAVQARLDERRPRGLDASGPTTS